MRNKELPNLLRALVWDANSKTILNQAAIELEKLDTIEAMMDHIDTDRRTVLNVIRDIGK